MATRKILKIGDPTLRKVSRPVTDINKRILMLLDDMAETMNAADGCGLAAPQIGVLRRVVVIDTGDGLIELINPEIVESSDEQEGSEGCLSIPDQRGFVVRPHKLTVRSLNRKGDTYELQAEGLTAVAVCHELDHLDGVLYVDKMTRLDDSGDEADEESQ